MAAQSPTTSDDQQAFKTCLLTLYVIALPTFLALHFIQAPYGKHRCPCWGPTIPSRLAWFLMESSTIWLTLALFPFGAHSLLLFFPFLLHYFHRIVLYPLRIPSSPSTSTPSPRFPVSIALMAFAFNLLNGYVQARSVSSYIDYGGETAAWFWGTFAAGAATFVAGMVANLWAYRVLTRLKAEGKGYRVPRGGLFEGYFTPYQVSARFHERESDKEIDDVDIPFVTLIEVLCSGDDVDVPFRTKIFWGIIDSFLGS
ncbi:hypothetical protein MLD38_031216 [Melastoma candidum]|uniref:Uncharacterized protein n=1 Tax=Melastoma candidum TaxID=119954 RepID=A0ACB9MNV4_9MYRT|nr:hypothetical protein MLD38_031216 [Melastoma candidum]